MRTKRRHKKNNHKPDYSDSDKTVDNIKVHIWESEITGTKANVVNSLLSPLLENFARDFAIAENNTKFDYLYKYNSTEGIEASNKEANSINSVEARSRRIRRYVAR